jgi:hypothetical protein
MGRFDEATLEVASDKAKTFKKLTLAKAVTEADVIIGLPKLKTHNLTYYTGAVKLLYGYIPGMFKTEFHLHTARDINLFADLLLDLHETYPPVLMIMDAIVGIEGDGPFNGNPRKIGLVLASKSCTALDYVAVTIAGFDPTSVSTVKLAQERGVGPARLEDIKLFREQVEPVIMGDFEKNINDVTLESTVVSREQLEEDHSCKTRRQRLQMYTVWRMLQGLPAESNNVCKSRRADDRLRQMHTLLLLPGTMSGGCYYRIHSGCEKAPQTLSCWYPSRQLPLLVGVYCLAWPMCGDYASRGKPRCIRPYMIETYIHSQQETEVKHV